MFFSCSHQILREEGVVACCTWPVLKELIIYDNPLTRNLKGRKNEETILLFINSKARDFNDIPYRT